MEKLSKVQLKQLNMHSVYIEKPEHPLFHMGQLMKGETRKDVLDSIMAISGSPNTTVGASYFMRRFGLFISMQLYMLSAYDKVWDGDFQSITFGVKKEYGLQTISTFLSHGDYRKIELEDRADVVKKILNEQCYEVIVQLRKVSSISPITLWENVFGYLLWHYHTLISQSEIRYMARKDLDLLRSNETWKEFAPRSYFNEYLQGKEPSMLINQPVRKTCCFSKDVPGLMKCTFCRF